MHAIDIEAACVIRFGAAVASPSRRPERGTRRRGGGAFRRSSEQASLSLVIALLSRGRGQEVDKKQTGGSKTQRRLNWSPCRSLLGSRQAQVSFRRQKSTRPRRSLASVTRRPTTDLLQYATDQRGKHTSSPSQGDLSLSVCLIDRAGLDLGLATGRTGRLLFLVLRVRPPLSFGRHTRFALSKDQRALDSRRRSSRRDCQTKRGMVEVVSAPVMMEGEVGRLKTSSTGRGTSDSDDEGLVASPSTSSRPSPTSMRPPSTSSAPSKAHHDDHDAAQASGTGRGLEELETDKGEAPEDKVQEERKDDGNGRAGHDTQLHFEPQTLLGSDVDTAAALLGLGVGEEEAGPGRLGSNNVQKERRPAEPAPAAINNNVASFSDHGRPSGIKPSLPRLSAPLPSPSCPNLPISPEASTSRSGVKAMAELRRQDLHLVLPTAAPSIGRGRQDGKEMKDVLELLGRLSEGGSLEDDDLSPDSQPQTADPSPSPSPSTDRLPTPLPLAPSPPSPPALPLDVPVPVQNILSLDPDDPSTRQMLRHLHPADLKSLAQALRQARLPSPSSPSLSTDTLLSYSQPNDFRPLRPPYRPLSPPPPPPSPMEKGLQVQGGDGSVLRRRQKRKEKRQATQGDGSGPSAQGCASSSLRGRTGVEMMLMLVLVWFW